MCPKGPLIALTTESRCQPAAQNPHRHPRVADGRGTRPRSATHAATPRRRGGTTGLWDHFDLVSWRSCGGTLLSAPPRGTRWGPFTRTDSRRSRLGARRGLTRNGGKCGPAAFEGQRSGTGILDGRPRRDRRGPIRVASLGHPRGNRRTRDPQAPDGSCLPAWLLERRCRAFGSANARLAVVALGGSGVGPVPVGSTVRGGGSARAGCARSGRPAVSGGGMERRRHLGVGAAVLDLGEVLVREVLEHSPRSPSRSSGG